MIDIATAEKALIELAAAWRGWDRRETADAVIAAKQAGWDFAQTFREASRLLLREDGEPAGLRLAAVKVPPRKAAAAPAETAHAWAAAAREACGFGQSEGGITA